MDKLTVVTGDGKELNASNQPNILNLLNFCKGLFILTIVEFHFTKADGSGFGWQGVHVFILLSGFGLTYSCLTRNRALSWKQWFLRRAERVLPAYWLVSVLGFFLVLFAFYAKHENSKTSVWFLELLKNFFLEISFLKVLSYKTMWSLICFDHMWFIPLIISFYVVFPFLYKFLTSKGNLTRNAIRLLAIALLIEFAYRFLAIYNLDGFPIGYENALFGVTSPKPLDGLPDSFPFQLYAPFGLFLARMGEFVLGMVGAVFLVHHPQKLQRLFSIWAVGIGLCVWLLGSSLIYVHRSGWIISDFLITIGLTLLSINLAWIAQQKLPFLFSKLSQIGILSFYIYLTHNFFIPFWGALQTGLLRVWSAVFQFVPETELISFFIKVLALGIFMSLILGSSWLLMRFDKSKLPKWMIQGTIAKVLAIVP